MTRLARALNSADLTHRETTCDVDVLQATGVVAIRKSLGVLILEAREGAAGDGAHAVARIKDLEEGLRRRIKAVAQRWKVRVDTHGVASHVARELVLDRCMHCQGRGVVPMKYDGTRLFAVSAEDEGARDVECTFCLGSGAAKRDYFARAKAAGWAEYTKRLEEWWEAVLESCVDAEISARRAVWRRLKKNTK